MKQKQRSQKIAQKRHDQKAIMDSRKPQKASPPKPIILTRKDIEGNIDLFEGFAERDILYMKEEKQKQRKMLYELLISSVIFIVVALHMLLNEPTFLGYCIVSAAVASQLTVAFRWGFSTESFKRWEGFYKTHIEYIQGWQLRLCEHNAGMRITMNI